MKITIETINHKDHRYPTLGDWQFSENGDLTIKVSETGNKLYDCLLGIHELVEAILCEQNGVLESYVDQWDINHPDADEPGDLPGCPYGFEHRVASRIEKEVCYSVRGIHNHNTWSEYECTLEDLVNKGEEDAKK